MKPSSKFSLIAVITIFTILFSPFNSFAQPNIEWQKSLGGTDIENAYSIQQTLDGGYIVAGVAKSTDGDVTGNLGGNDYWIVKLSNTGSIDWQKSLGGTNNDYAYSIQQTSDGGYIVAGSSSSTDGDVTGNNGSFDYWIVKLTSTGSIEWQKSLGGTVDDGANFVQETSDGGYIVAGYCSSTNGDITGNHGGYDYGIVKLTSTGSIEWQKSLGGTDDDFPSSILQTTDGGYIVAGLSNSNDGDATGNHGAYDYWLVKLTSTGSIDWQKSFGGNYDDNANSIQQTADGGFIVAGRSQSTNGDITGNHGNNDYWIVKITNTGIIEWEKSLGGTDSDYALSIQQTSDEGYIVAGVAESTDGDVSVNLGYIDYWIVKLTSTGNIDWEQSLGGTDADYALSIQQTSDGGYIVAGYSYSNDGDITGNNGEYDYWIVKLGEGVAIEEPLANDNEFNIYPNPAQINLTISINVELKNAQVEIYNVMGEKVYNAAINNKLATINTKQFSSGIYFVIIVAEGKHFTKKLIVE